MAAALVVVFKRGGKPGARLEHDVVSRQLGLHHSTYHVCNGVIGYKSGDDDTAL